ncbi:MAG: hypothetical protein JJ966_00705 [Balneolaceae bacterium]|nr:hypothetical protein [Balneolaceae bacterium]
MKYNLSSDFLQNHLVISTILLVVVYYLFSIFSEGFYQHDEAAHFTNMLQFWHQPEVIMGNWGKPGFKLIYAPVALLGLEAVTLLNCLFAAACSFVAYKIMEQLGYSRPWLVFIFLATQPFWIELSFRTYSEILTAFLLVSSVWAFYARKHWLAALLLSYILTIRQEFYPIVGLFALYLAVKKEWKSVLLILVFPFTQHIAGWILFGNPWYLYDAIFGFSGAIQSAYPRQGGEHYFLMLLPVIGGVTFTFLVAFFVQGLMKRKTWYWPILLPCVIFFTIHVLFSMESIKIGPSTGGNLRYLMVIAPLLAILAAIGAERIYEQTSKKERLKYLWVFIPLILIAIFFMSFEHNHLKYTYKRDFSHILILILTFEIAILGLSKQWINRLIIGVSLLGILLTVRPKNLSEEDQIVKVASAWIDQNYTQGTQWIFSHTLIPYYLNKVPQDFEPNSKRVKLDAVQTAEIGSIIVWDAHYSYRPRRDSSTLPLDYFLQNPDQFEQIKDPISTQNQVFSMYFFKKISN